MAGDERKVTLSAALKIALEAAGAPDKRDAAAWALAGRYAVMLDASQGGEFEAALLKELGPRFLATLAALGLTPAARGGAPAVPVEPVGPSSTLQQMRDEVGAQRAKREGRAG